MPERIARETVVDIAHDFNGPLSTMWLETIILERRLSGESLRAVRAIQRNIEVLVAVIGDLMDLSRIAEGSLQLQRTSSDLRALVERALARTVAEVESARVVLDPGPAISASVDAPRLERVVTNLVATAMGEAAPTSRIAVSVTRAPASVRITVAADEPDPRPQPDAERRRIALGLHLGRTVVEMHGGRLLTGDARFVVDLPAAEAR